MILSSAQHILVLLAARVAVQHLAWPTRMRSILKTKDFLDRRIFVEYAVITCKEPKTRIDVHPTTDETKNNKHGVHFTVGDIFLKT